MATIFTSTGDRNATTTSDISNRTAAYAAAEFLRRAIPFLVFELFGQSYELPTNSTKVMKFRRYEALDATPNALTEGVTPAGKTLTTTDVTATLSQYGDLVTITDVINDTNEDNTLKQAIEVLGEQAAEMLERVRFGILKAGTNVYYANGSARDAVNTALTLTLQRKITRFLKGQKATQITKILRSTPSYGTEAVAPSFVAICHPNCETDIRSMTGFKDVVDYGSMSSWPNEIGSVEGVRYVYSTIIEPWADAGGDKGLMMSTTGTKADVYPVLYVAKEAYGIVPLKGRAAVSPMVLNPNIARGGDPLGQRGSVAWKTMQTAVILNQAWIVRAEVAVTD
jgi:N4-gp56 family major capsid protein